MENIYYVYAYIYNEKSDIRKIGNPYYIGKGTKNRAWSKHANVKIPTDLSYIVILESNLTELGALALERRYIEWYGKICDGSGILLNITDGGDNPPSWKGKQKTQEHIRKIQETKEKNGTIKHTDETKLKMSMNRKGKPKIKGIPRPAEVIEKMSMNRKSIPPWNKGIKMTEDQVKNMKKPKSVEGKENIRLAQKKRREIELNKSK
jgi:hypothetical protein